MPGTGSASSPGGPADPRQARQAACNGKAGPFVSAGMIRVPRVKVSGRFRPVAAGLAIMAAVFPGTVPAAGDPAEPFLAALRRFADQGIVQGRDTYGRPTPLFVDGVEVATGRAVTWKWADEKEWVICNLATQQGLFRTLDGLSTLTGDPRYKAEALAALRHALRHLRYGGGGEARLMAWGGHLAYNATDDVIAGNPDGSGRVHELKCHFPHYGLMWEADAAATREIIESSWNSHVLDWATLDFNRHGVPRGRGKLWASDYGGGKVYFEGEGLTFHNAGSDLYFSAGLLSRLSGDPAPLPWAVRLSQRYADTRHPATGLEGFQFSQSASAWCDGSGKIRGDRARYQFAASSRGTSWWKARSFLATATRRWWKPRWAACCWPRPWGRTAGSSSTTR